MRGPGHGCVGLRRQELARAAINYVEEAIGIVQAAQQSEMPVVISFTVETDGRLPTGQSLSSAIQQTDEATSQYVSYYMINCAHTTHFWDTLDTKEPCRRRIKGLRGNASKLSHAQLDEATELDEGNPYEFGSDYAKLKQILPHLNIFGGCCGTDHRHIEQTAIACKPFFEK